MPIDPHHPDPAAQLDLEQAARQPVAWGYARVSTRDQNLALQRDALLAAGVRPEHLVEEKESGVKRRPAFEALLERLRPGDSLIVWHIDRLGRSAIDLLRVSARLRDNNIRLVITTLGIDTATLAGRLVYGILAQVAEAERERIIERTEAGLASAKARGELLGRRPQLTAHQRAIAKQMIADGRTYGEVARHFNVSRTTAYRAVNGEAPRKKKVTAP